MKGSAEVENVFFLYFQRGKAKENTKLFTCCLIKTTRSISTHSSPTTCLTHDKLDFLKER